MQDIGLQWNPTKCSIAHVRKGKQVTDDECVIMDENSVIKCLEGVGWGNCINSWLYLEDCETGRTAVCAMFG